jgi:hypothetical protein
VQNEEKGRGRLRGLRDAVRNVEQPGPAAAIRSATLAGCNCFDQRLWPRPRREASAIVATRQCVAVRDHRPSRLPLLA